LRKFTRRMLVSGSLASIAGGAVAWNNWPVSASPGGAFDESVMGQTVGAMPHRKFGRTGLEVSEVGFGSWATGGQSYGAVDHADSLRALARAQELGCNFIDTAMNYGDAELVIGEFLQGRRDKWVVATKYSGQEGGLEATLDRQLIRLRTDYVDFYQIHWVPKDNDRHLYDELASVKRAGKARFIGVSLYNANDIDYVIDHTQLDGVQLPFSLLDPVPFLARARRLRDSGLAVVARSSLKEGFLTGKYSRDSKFSDPHDRRSGMTRSDIERTVANVDAMRFLEQEQGSILLAAARYPLSFSEISTVIMGTKNLSQANGNFGDVPGRRLSDPSLRRVAELQDELGLWSFRDRLARGWRVLRGE
jgi:aryl-alcohol dehydrogenase-like predicted oxidoreductase